MSIERNDDPLARTIVQDLSNRIRDGVLQDGDKLPAERALMAEFGASRGAIREAIHLMATQGLLETKPRHRPTVRAPGFDTAVTALESIVAHLLTAPNGVKNLFDTRIMIEAMLVRHAANFATKEDIQLLKEALAANGAVLDDNAAFFQTDKRFHEILYSIPRNPAWLSVHMAYTTWLEPQWSRMPRNPQRNSNNFQAHTEIFNAILMRDPDQAEAALNTHLKSAWDQVRVTFGDI